MGNDPNDPCALQYQQSAGTDWPARKQPMYRYFVVEDRGPEGGLSDHPNLVWLDRRVDELRVTL